MTSLPLGPSGSLKFWLQFSSHQVFRAERRDEQDVDRGGDLRLDELKTAPLRQFRRYLPHQHLRQAEQPGPRRFVLELCQKRLVLRGEVEGDRRQLPGEPSSTR